MELKQIEHMIELQDSMNSKINPEWRTAGYDYLRAAWIEAGELMEHYGYKWWRKTTPDIPQAQMELVDIWHFLLSDLIRDGYDPLVILNLYNESFDLEFYWKEFEPEEFNVRNIIETFIYFTLQQKDKASEVEEHPVIAFFVLCRLLEVDSNTLYLKYTGKNVLNFFRQDKGYKEGTYIKIWNGREDNEHLDDILKGVPNDEEDVQQYIYNQLAIVYSTVEYKNA